MAERQIGHRKSSLVLPRAFPSSNDVPVLLLNQPNPLSKGNVTLIWHWNVIGLGKTNLSWKSLDLPETNPSSFPSQSWKYSTAPLNNKRTDVHWVLHCSCSEKLKCPKDFRQSLFYSRTPVTRTQKANKKQFKLARVPVIRVDCKVNFQC